MTRCSATVCKAMTLALLAGTAAAAMAQPTTFIDIGPITAAATPASVREYVQLPFELFDQGFDGQGEVLTIKWIRFTLPQAIEGDRYLDIDSRIYTVDGEPGDLFMVLYDNEGNLIASDDADGSFPEGFAAGLSFGGNGAFRLPPDTPALRGQDASALSAGTYWFALVAGNSGSVTANPNTWDTTTAAAYTLGLFTEGTYYVELSFFTGNTTPLPPPANDDCANALVIGENPSPTVPVWTGSNAGATNDGIVPCYRGTGPLAPRDIWFLYTPTATGIAEVIATGGAGGAATPIIARYSQCGSVPLQCTGGSSFRFDDDTRLSFPVVAGEPQLIGLSVFAGTTGPMELFVRLLPPPCPLVIPDGAIAESEAVCGDSSNDGCNVTPPAYDQLAIGQTVRGTLFNTRTLRDTDWYEFQLPVRSQVTLSFASQFPSGAVIVGRYDFAPEECGGPNLLTIINGRYAGQCVTYSGTIELPAGTHRAVIANAFFDGVGCGSGYEQYWLRVDATPITAPCLADIAGGADGGGDGTLDGADFIAFINSFAIGDTAADPAADVAGAGDDGLSPDGTIDGSDFIAFINAFAIGC